jgi:aryl-alcohol dehydrogenase-like predicted oxidoreductase
MAMELRMLGATGIRVSPLGLGTVKFGRDRAVKYPAGFVIPDDRAVRELLALAWDLGINLIDTAPAYGNSEERLGALLPGDQDWKIVTKVGESFEGGHSSFDYSAKATRASVERSLRRLRRDCLDVVLVHSNGEDLHIARDEDVMAELQALKAEGLVRAYGMSTKTVAGGLWAVDHCDVVMATCNLAERSDIPVIEAAHRLNKGVLVKKGLQSGHAHAAHGGSGVEESLRYVFSHPGVTSVTVGTINPEHLRENVAITERVLAELAAERARSV